MFYSGTIVNVTTQVTTTYDYLSVTSLTRPHMMFSVTACSDARILVSGEKGDIAEIWIGYSSNTCVGIFTPREHVPLAEQTVYNVLDCNMPRYFWVRTIILV